VGTANLFGATGSCAPIARGPRKRPASCLRTRAVGLRNRLR